MASKKNLAMAADVHASAELECILSRLVQFLVSPSLNEEFVSLLVSAGEKTAQFHGRISRETLRHNVKKYICCRGKMEQYVSDDILRRYLRPGSSKVLDNICYLISYLMFKPASEDEVSYDFVSLGKDILTQCTYLLGDFNMLLSVKPPSRTLVGRILHYYKNRDVVFNSVAEKPAIAATDAKTQRCGWFDLVFQEDHNPKFNGIEVLLSHEKRKAAYMLMEIGNDYLCFRGIRIIDNFRRLGLTYTLLKVWLLLCAILKKEPTTIKINKPLLCIGLQKLGCVAIKKKDPIEVCKPDWACESQNEKDKNIVTIWSENINRLRGLYSKSFLKTQKIEIVEEKPVSSHTIFISKYTIDSVLVDEINKKTIDNNKVLVYNSRFYAFIQMIKRKAS